MSKHLKTWKISSLYIKLSNPGPSLGSGTALIFLIGNIASCKSLLSMVLGRQLDSAPRWSRIQEILGFLSLFFVLHGFLRWGLQYIWLKMGFAAESLQLVLADNEMAVQTLCLLSACFGVRCLRGKSSLFSLFADLFPWPTQRHAGHFDRVVSLSTTSLFRGFLLASVGIVFCVFSGFSQFESVTWDISAFSAFLPLWGYQIFILLFWLLAIELSRSILLPLLIEFSDNSISSRLLWIAFESFLLFRVVNRDSDWIGQSLTLIGSTLLASVLVLWFEQGRSMHAESWRVALARVGILFGFWASLSNIYGFPVGSRNLISFVHVFEGPVASKLTSLSPVRLETLVPIFFWMLLTWFGSSALRRSYFSAFREMWSHVQAKGSFGRRKIQLKELTQSS